MTKNRLALFQKFIEDLTGIKPKNPQLLRLDKEAFEEYSSNITGKTKICLQ